MPPEERTREANAVLYVVGVMDHYKEIGLVGGGKASMKPHGVHLFDQLYASGFRPTYEEVVDSLAVLDQKHPRDVDRDMVTLILNYDTVKNLPELKNKDET